MREENLLTPPPGQHSHLHGVWHHVLILLAGSRVRTRVLCGSKCMILQRDFVLEVQTSELGVKR